MGLIQNPVWGEFVDIDYFIEMKEEEQPKSRIMAYIDKMEQQRQERGRNTIQNLSKEIVWRRGERQQEFYRQLLQLGQKEMVMRKLGWKITKVERHQQDLLLFCFSLLTSYNLVFPLHVFTNTIQDQDGTITKDLWMEVSIHAPDESLDLYEVEHNIEVKIYHLCQDKLLPLFRQFIETHLDWSQLIREENTSQRVALLFEEEVIKSAVKIITNDLSPK